MHQFRVNYKSILAFLIGIILALTVGYILYKDHFNNLLTYHVHDDENETKVHVHADFLFYINDTRIRLTEAKYQSDESKVLSPHIHIHDGDDEVIHRHANDITLATFMESLGFLLTNTCLTTDTGVEYCNDGDMQVMLMVNNQRVDDIVSYVTEEEDKILLYYGDIHNPKIKDYVGLITDKACITSGTCPERGIPPPENCGLSCEYVPKK